MVQLSKMIVFVFLSATATHGIMLESVSSINESVRVETASRRRAAKELIQKVKVASQEARDKVADHETENKTTRYERTKRADKHLLLEALYQGRDIPDDKLGIDDFFAGNTGRFESEHLKTERNVSVFGLQNSGVSLLNSLLFTNFGRRLTYFSADYAGSPKPNLEPGMWKHANFKELIKLDANSDGTLKEVSKLNSHSMMKKMWDEDVYTMAVVRDPYSWLLSMRAAGNADSVLAKCTSGTGWLTQKCSHPNPGGPTTKVPAVTYEGLADVWNHFNEGYVRAQRYGFRKHMLVTYESLLNNPEQVMTRISQFLDIKMYSAPKHPLRSEGSAERVEGLAGASRANGANKHLSEFEGLERREACARLDADVQNTMKYPVLQCEKLGPAKPPPDASTKSH